MAARTRLNEIYAVGSIVVAALIGGVTGSWAVFLLALLITIAACLHSGDIRLRPGPRR